MLLSLISAGLTLAASPPSGPPDLRAALDSMVASERAFSRMSVEKGMRDAFIAHLAEDGVVFQPLPVNGRKAWQARPAPQATLIWEPAFAAIAGAGDLGYTTGPWELRPPATAADRPVVHGHFISVWRRERDGAWKVAIDLGTSHPAPGADSKALAEAPLPQARATADRRRPAENGIREAEKQLSLAALKRGLAAAILERAAPDVRFNRDGHFPALGADEARTILAADSRRARWTPQGVGASSSGDLGYSYGVRERLSRAGAVADTSVFLDVWRRSAAGRWELVMAVDNPLARRP